MATRRRRSRRRWSLSRLQRRAVQYRPSIVRGLWGGLLLVAVWWLWPGPAPIDRGGRWHVHADGPAAVGALEPPRTGMAVSAKSQIAGDAVVSRARVEDQLRQLAEVEAARAAAGRDHLDAAIAAPAVAVSDASGAATSGPPAPRRGPPSRAPAAPAQAVAGAASEATDSDSAPSPPATARPRGMPAAVAPQPVGEAPAIVLAEPPAGPAVEIVRPGALGAGAGEMAKPRRDGISSIQVPMVRVAAAATAPESSPRRGDAAGSDRAASRMVAAPVARAGQPPTWLRNAVAPAIYDRPMIAVVIDDLGMNRSGTAALNRLPAPLTLAFLPYAPKLDEQTRAARAAGHELLVHVPMEPTGGEWPGPNALTSQLGSTELTSRLRAHLHSFRGFVGINNHMGSRVTADTERMDLVMAELRKHGLLFLDSRTSPGSVAGREARRWHVPYAERDVFLDNEIELAAVIRQLALVERIARRRGYAVAIGHPHKVTIEALRRWLPALDAKGFALAPISAVVARRYCAEDGPAPDDPCTHYTATASLMP